MARKDYIGPTIKQRKTVILPEGPTADLSPKATQGMLAAKGLVGGEDVELEGKPVEKPLQMQMGPPIPNFKPKPRKTPEGFKSNISETEKKVGQRAMLGNTHIGSYQTLLANDRMEKPIMNGWSDEDSSNDTKT